MRKIDLCSACSHKLEQAYTVRKVAGGIDHKVKCAECGCKRYGGTYEVETKAKKKRSEA